MSNDKNVLSLPGAVGEETIISLQKAVEVLKPGSGPTGFKRRNLAKGELLYPLGAVPDAIYMLRAGSIRLKASASTPSSMPVTKDYHASPSNGANRPLLGARYFFNRQPCSIEYVAELPCSLYKITSGALQDLHEASRQDVILMMYWLVSCSDLTEFYIPQICKELGLEQHPVDETMGLISAIEEFRAAREDARMPGLLYRLFKNLVAHRINRAKELGIEASIVPLAPRF